MMMKLPRSILRAACVLTVAAFTAAFGTVASHGEPAGTPGGAPALFQPAPVAGPVSTSDPTIDMNEAYAPLPGGSAAVAPKQRTAQGTGSVGPFGFEPAEGFVPGSLDGQQGWLNFTTNFIPDMEGHVDVVNPAAGVQHVRIADNPGADGNVGSFSPDAPDPSGQAILTVDLYISGDTTKTWRLQPQSPAQMQLTAILQFNPDGTIFAADDNGNCGDTLLSFVDTGFTWTPDAYVTTAICLDVANDRIRYFYGDDMVHSTGSGEGGIGGPNGCGVIAGSTITHGLLYVPQLAGQPSIVDGSHLDFDNFSIVEGACPDPLGACCDAPKAGACSRISQPDCAAVGGTYAGNNSDCADVECDLVAVCQAGEGDCFEDNSPAVGCGDLDCCLAVCGQDSFCCVVTWDSGCAELAAANPEACPPPSLCPSCPDGCEISPNCQSVDTSNASNSTAGEFEVADDFTPAVGGVVDSVCWSGAYAPAELPDPASDNFTIRYYSCVEGVPTDVLAEFRQSDGTLAITGKQNSGALVAGAAPIYEYSADHVALTVEAGSVYFIEIVNQFDDAEQSWFWEFAAESNNFGHQKLDGLESYARHTQTQQDHAFCLAPIELGSTEALCALPPNQPCLLPDELLMSADVQEAEPCGLDPDVNLGCSDGSLNFSNIPEVSIDGALPTLIRGRAWADSGARDIDWWKVQVPAACDVNGDGECNVCLAVSSELSMAAVPVLEDLADGPCGSTSVFALDAQGFECGATLEVGYAIDLSTDLNVNGEIYILARPNDGIEIFDGAPCGGNGITSKGNNYLMELAVVDTFEQCFPCADDADCEDGESCVDGVCTAVCGSPGCVTDLNGNGETNAADLAQLLGAWGACGGPPCCADLNGDGVVNAADLAQLLGAWGPCP